MLAACTRALVWWWWVLATYALAEEAPPAAFRLPQHITSHAVLQAEAPRLTGWAPSGENVTVRVSDGEEVRATAAASGEWTAVLRPRKASASGAAGVSITVATPSVPTAIVLSDIVFGDVWVCSGQSNMEFAVAEMLDAKDVIATSYDPLIRLLSVSKVKSAAVLDDVPMTQDDGWQRAGPQSICGGQAKNGSQYPKDEYCQPHCAGCTASWATEYKRHTWGYFSAVCFVHGRTVRQTTGRPQGLIAASWGGSPIEIWSPPGVGSSCPGAIEPSRAAQLSTAWNSMVKPLTGFPIKGAVWFQGESNYPEDWNATMSSGKLAYPCKQSALIAEWRTAWAAVNSPWGNQNFSFVLQQLAAWDKLGPPASGPGLAPFRYGQSASQTDLPNVGMAVAHDLYDPESPCTSIHPRNKTAMGERLARLSLSLGFPGALNDVNKPNLRVDDIALAKDKLIVRFRSEDLASEEGYLHLRPAVSQNQTTTPTLTAFELRLAEAGGLEKWVALPPAAVKPSVDAFQGVALTLPRGTTVTAVRYAWQSIPTGLLLYGGAAGTKSPTPAGNFYARYDHDGRFVLAKPAMPSPPGPS